MLDPVASDKSLIRGVKSGDEAAATALYHRYAARVMGLVSQQMADHLKSSIEPEDIVQSVFKSVFRGVVHKNYHAPAGGSLWHLIAVLVVHKVRSKARCHGASKRDYRRTESLDGASEAEISQSSPHEWEVAIRECLERLTVAEQEATQLRIQGFTVEEIAAQMGKSRRSVERLLQSAREELAKMLASDE